jgi:hypothetical protein
LGNRRLIEGADGFFGIGEVLPERCGCLNARIYFLVELVDDLYGSVFSA